MMVVPLCRAEPAGILCLYTLPTPESCTFSPWLSSRNTASFAPIPMTLGTDLLLILVVFKLACAVVLDAFPQMGSSDCGMVLLLPGTCKARSTYAASSISPFLHLG